jgi:hypothetical protein
MPTPIIDYASPASRRSLRLPARSEIRWVDGPGYLRITQVLSGREGAIGALLLAGFTFAVMTISVHGMAEKWHRFMGEIMLLGAFMLAELIVGALVIQSTWRKTILTVTRDEMTLEMSAPFTPREQFIFRSEEVAAVTVVDRDAQPGEAVVPELEIRLWTIPAVRLFAGHPRGTLMILAQQIGRVQPLAPPPLPGSVAQAGAAVAPRAIHAPPAAPASPASPIMPAAQVAQAAPTPPAITPIPPAPIAPPSSDAPPAPSDGGFTVNL